MADDAIVRDSMIPMYQQIKEFIIGGIREGRWKSDEKLPSETDLTKILGASRMTINRAMRELSSEGYVKRVPTVGTFVTKSKPSVPLFVLHDISKDIRDSHGEYSCQIIELGCISDPELSEEYGTLPDDQLFHSVIVHKGNGTPIQIEERWINPVVVPDYLKIDFSKTTTFNYLRKFPITEVEHKITASKPSSGERRLLEINDDEPCLTLTRKSWNQRIVVAKSLLISPGSRYSLTDRFLVRN